MGQEGRIRKPFLILTLIGFLVYLANGSASPFLPLYVRTLGGSVADVAWVVSGYAVASVASNLAWGRLTDRRGRRKPLVVGAMATLMVTTSLIAHAPTWQALVLLRVVEGAAFASYNVGALAMLGDMLEDDGKAAGRRGQMLGVYRTGGSLAFAVAIVLSGAAAERYGYHVTYALAGGVYALAFLVSLALPEPPRHAAAARGTPGELRELARLARGPLLPLTLAVLAWMLPFSAVYSVWPIYVANVQGLGSAGYARLWGLAAFLEVPSMIIAGRLADRLGRRTMFALALALFAGIYAAYALAPAPWGLVVAQIVRGFAFAAFTATALSALVELAPPEARGRATGVYQLASGSAQIVGNALGGPVSSAAGFPATFLGAGAVTLAGVAAVLRPARVGATQQRLAGD